jgi:hypothetical protein
MSPRYIKIKNKIIRLDFVFAEIENYVSSLYGIKFFYENEKSFFVLIGDEEEAKVALASLFKEIMLKD